MVFDGEIIPLTLYAITRETGRSGEWLYMPFATLHHIRHCVFDAAKIYNFLEIYGYKEGEYEPYSEIVERGIAKYLVYNPYHDYYEASAEGKLKLPDLYNEIKTVLREEEINRLKGARLRSEKYTAKELNLIFHSYECDYIKVKPPNIPYEFHKPIQLIYENMLFHYNWLSEPDKITKQSVQNGLKYFNVSNDYK